MSIFVEVTIVPKAGNPFLDSSYYLTPCKGISRPSIYFGGGFFIVYKP
jgi:hypothetical protein